MFCKFYILTILHNGNMKVMEPFMRIVMIVSEFGLYYVNICHDLHNCSNVIVVT